MPVTPPDASSRQTATRIAPSVFCASLLAAACLFISLGHKPLVDWDEAIYAGISKAMLGGHFLTMTWHFQNFMEKPPLSMWLTAGFFRLFGVNEFWARAASALSGIAVVAILHGLIARLRGLPAAWLTTIVLLTMRGFARAGRVGELDMLLTLGCCLSLWGIHRIRSGQPRGWYLFWIGFAVALMTKSAASVVIPLTLTVLVVSESIPERSRIWSFCKEFFAGAALFLALVAPWHLYMTHRYGAAFWHEYLGVQVFARSTVQLDHHNNPPWFYLGVLAVYAAPWLRLLPFVLVKGFQKKPLREFLVFTLVVFILFTVAKTRLTQYIVPIYPALAVITADWMYGWLTTGERAERPRRLRFGAALAAAALVASSLIGRTTTDRLLGRSIVTKGQVESKWLIPLLRTAPAQPANDPILLCIDGDWMPLPAAVFYTGRHLQQVYVSEKPDIRGEAHRYYDDPQPLASFVDTSSRLIVIDKEAVKDLPSIMNFQEIREDGQLAMGTIALRPGLIGPGEF